MRNRLRGVNVLTLEGKVEGRWELVHVEGAANLSDEEQWRVDVSAYRARLAYVTLRKWMAIVRAVKEVFEPVLAIDLKGREL